MVLHLVERVLQSNDLSALHTLSSMCSTINDQAKVSALLLSTAADDKASEAIGSMLIQSMLPACAKDDAVFVTQSSYFACSSHQTCISVKKLVWSLSFDQLARTADIQSAEDFSNAARHLALARIWLQTAEASAQDLRRTVAVFDVICDWSRRNATLTDPMSPLEERVVFNTELAKARHLLSVTTF